MVGVEIFKKVKEDIGLVFLGKRAEGGSVERGRWLGCGGDFREVRENIGLVFGCEEEGGKWREREVVGLWGRFLGK